MVGAGIDYVQLMDQNHGGTSYFCYSQKHNHPNMPGKWQVDAVKNLLKEVQEKGGKTLFGCESAAAQSYIPYLLFSDNRFNLAYYIGRPVPMYAYVYHEYLNNFLGDTGMECSWFSLIPSMYYLAEIAKGNSDLEKIKSGFYDMFGIEWDTFMLLDLPNTANFHYYPDGPSDHHKIANCERHFIYNDCFYGLVDNIDRPEYADEFKAAAERLDKAVVTEEYAYLFEWVRDICNVLAYKCNLGNRTREAYLNRDLDALKELLPVYDKVIEKMEIFYKSFEKRWMTENLSYGFEVHDIRVGGLIKRVTHCKEMLQHFINGEIDRIEQLDEPVLDMFCRENDNSPVACLDWKPFFTTSTF